MTLESKYDQLRTRLRNLGRVSIAFSGGADSTFLLACALAVALGADDSPELHLQDTLAAGAGLVREEAARILVGEGPQRVRELLELIEPPADALDEIDL